MKTLLLSLRDRAYLEVVLAELLACKWNTISAPQLPCDSFLPIKG